MVLVRPRRMADEHTTGVLVFGGDEWKSFSRDESGYWFRNDRRGGVLFNHVPFFSRRCRFKQREVKSASFEFLIFSF